MPDGRAGSTMRETAWNVILRHAIGTTAGGGHRRGAFRPHSSPLAAADTHAKISSDLGPLTSDLLVPVAGTDAHAKISGRLRLMPCRRSWHNIISNRANRYNPTRPPVGREVYLDYLRITSVILAK